MAKYNFSKKFNSEKKFNIETENFDYVSLEQLHLDTLKDPNHVFVVKGIYINSKGMYDAQPVIALEDTYVNLPSHQCDVCRQMIADPAAVVAINEGHLGFIITTYYKARYARTCYAVEWVDL